MKRCLFIIMGAFIFHHITCTILYLSPPNLIKQSFNQHVHSYMTSFFSQNWHLFSPNPGISYTRIAVQCSDSDWQDPIAEIQASHQGTRILGYGKLLSVYEDLAKRIRDNYKESDAECKKVNCRHEEFLSEIRATQDVSNLRRLSANYCAQISGQPLSELKLLEFFPQKYTDRASKVPWSKVYEYKL